MVAFLRFLLVFRDFFVKICCLPALNLFSFPVPVFVKRFAAALLVFNFGMIIPEALIVGTPVMASLGTPWEALNVENCGWWRDNSPESIAGVIEEIKALSPAQLYAMGARGREYILKNFAADRVATQMYSLYQWLNGDSGKPDFVKCI